MLDGIHVTPYSQCFHSMVETSIIEVYVSGEDKAV